MADEVIKFTIKASDATASAFKSSAASIKKLAGVTKTLVLGTVAAAGAVVFFTNKIAANLDLSAKFARRIGVSVTELSKLQFGAELAGLSVSTFNMATQRMTRRVAEAAKGTGEAKDAIRELGIDAKAFKNLGLEDQMETLADRMSTVSDESEKLRLAFKLFDSEGTAVLQMLKGGSEAMREAAKDAEFLGLAISEKAAANAEKFKDSMTRATGSITGISRAVAGELMPVLSGLANRFADTLASHRKTFVNMTRNTITGVFTIIEVIKQMGDGIRKVFSDPKAFGAFVSNLLSLVPKVLAISLAIGKFLAQGVFEGIKISMFMFTGFGEWIGTSLAQIVAGHDVTNIAEAWATRLAEGIGNARGNMEAALKELRGVVGVGFGDILETFQDTFGINMDLAKEKAKEAMNSLMEFGTIAGDQLTEQGENILTFSEEMAAQYDVFLEGLRNNSKTFAESFMGTMKGVIDSISQGMASVIVEGGSLLKVFQGIAKEVIKQVIAAFIKMAIERLVLSVIGKGASRSEAIVDGSKAVALAGANMFASWAGAPWPISLGAPAAAAEAITGASASFSSGAAIGAGLGAGIGGIAHGGLTDNPDEQTFLIRRGERIVSPNQNADLTEFLRGSGGGGGRAVTIEHVEIVILPNATNAEAIFDMPREQLQAAFEDPIIDILNTLDFDGIKPVFEERR